MISVNNNLDVAPLDDLEDIPDIESLSGDISEHVLDFTQQLEQLTSSLTGSELPTPISGELLFGCFGFNYFGCDIRRRSAMTLAVDVADRANKRAVE